MKPLVLVLILLGAVAMAVAHPVHAGSGLREFRDVEELTEWIAKQPIVLVDYGNGVPWNPTDKCGYLAQGIQSKAYFDGFIVSTEIVEWGRMFGKRVSDTSVWAHMGNSTCIGNKVYYFEKLSDGGYTVIEVATR